MILTEQTEDPEKDRRFGQNDKPGSQIRNI